MKSKACVQEQVPWPSTYWELSSRKEWGRGTIRKPHGLKPPLLCFCIRGRQCALCPWVGSGTLLRLSPRPAVNLKWRRSRETATGGRVTHRSFSLLLWIFIFPLPHDDTSPFSSASLAHILHQPPIICRLYLEKHCRRSRVEGQEVFQNSIRSTHGTSHDWLALKLAWKISTSTLVKHTQMQLFFFSLYCNSQQRPFIFRTPWF